MAKYRCTVCDYIYDEETEGIKWEDLPDDWVCPVCESGKTDFVREEEAEAQGDEARPSPADAESFIRTSDDLEVHMADIHRMAETGQSVTEPMRTQKAVVSWDDLLILGAQLARIPLDHDAPVRTETVIGPAARKPLVIDIPLYVSHMSFGALSREAKIALARGSAAVHTATCSGEGGILPEEREHAYRYIFEYVPNRYSVTDENLRKADAIEIKIGQSTKPGMGGHLPGRKVTKEIAAIRGFPEGEDIISPSRFSDITDRESLKAKVGELRRRSGGRPIGIKFAAGHIEADMEAAVYAGPDFITIDGRPGGTGASPKYIKAATSVPTVYALYRARRYLNEKKIKNISLIITGGLRVSSDFAKALALGADAVALATASMIAIGCQQYRVCHQGTCPKGIATHDPDLRARLDVEQAARGLENFFRVSAEELKSFARLTGHDDVHGLSMDDVCTTCADHPPY